ncbi:asparagine synthase [Stemphylium lycopersici]|nr:asparagine synthase [Stemphylium lycopersici]
MHEELSSSLDAIAHRGPDSRGIWISEDNYVGLGHCRLAIQDLSSDGEQPMHDSENEVHAVVNGEIYDYDKVREHVSKEFGYVFKGHSDSELVVALYKHYGLSLFQYLRGEFAFCIYDSKTGVVVAGRDRYGIKPLFWTRAKGRLLLGAEVKAFSALGWQAEWDTHGLVDEAWQFGSGTLFKGVQKVRPGHYLICMPSGTMETREYWDVSYPDHKQQQQVGRRSEEEMVVGVRARLLESVRQRMRADVPVGIYLSGGIDSSVVAGMAHHLQTAAGGREELGSQGAATAAMTCFSVGFEVPGGGDGALDESATASRTAAWLGVKHHILPVGETELADNLEQAVYHAEHHNQNLNFVGKFLLSRMVHAHGYRVVLTGEGADEQFAGYPMFRPDMVRGEDEHHQGDRVAAADDAMARLLDQRGSTACANVPPVVGRELRAIGTARALSAYQLAPECWHPSLPAPRPLETLAAGMSVSAKFNMQHKWHPLHAALYVWTKSHLANSILSCLGDRTEMAHSLEARTPFLDHHLTSYVNSLPPAVKLRYDASTSPATFTEKWILREAARPFVLPELYARQKHAYTAPMLYRIGGPLHRLYTRLLTQNNVARLGFLDWLLNSLAYAAALGMTKQLHLHGSQYSWLSSTFYIGYLLLQFPTTYILTRLPIGKYLGVSLILWGLCLPLMATCSSFASVATVRFVMGMLEAGLLPTCIILTATWYTREEQPLRTALWFGPFSGIFGGVLAYFVDSVHSTLPAWKLLFIIYGVTTVALGVTCLIAMPDHHDNAWFLRPSEVHQAKMRTQENNTGLSTRQPWNFSHIFEATKDAKYWLIVIFAIAQSITNAGITNFSPLIISGFGYSRGYTLLLAAPQGGIALVVQVAASIATLYMTDSRCLLWILSCIPAFIGVLMIRLVPVSTHRNTALMGLYLTGFYNTSWVMAMSLVSSNTAGATKKSFTAVSLAICYAVGNIVGPHFFLDSEKPYYHSGIDAMMVAFATMAVCGGLYRYICIRQNKARDRSVQYRLLPTLPEEQDETALGKPDSDKTDKEILAFRYTY